ncbi:unnamed protein product [Vitrella brassicaformis CCMP3155]|uniref:Peptidase S74 domain-containing protein n=1 Tax=Vitrella brassicaformis (strain CCMP3155) TaxID=1169540 RepID=A0A0G4EGB5_VITBC|nr:unnamed protein product [Vitrella brassicaformis CCMP3155]|mmetsp:Transcript_43328/g.122783  ORF Transcript_43328/g.122783 Transcript_43328/m.122783 type:complete len:141 (+) Transcript_43328:2240-2662(+)|eukprot:CEL94432.1 unnamed protein product [Vitrella brassicaformis CCMP3155]
MAEWGEHNRSAAHDAFKQLQVRTDGDQRLLLVPNEVEKLFPSAVRSFDDDEGDKGDDEDEEGEGDSMAATSGDEAAEGQSDKKAIDLSQLLLTQMSFVQTMEKNMKAMSDEIRGLTEANKALLGRVARLERGPSEGLMAP